MIVSRTQLARIAVDMLETKSIGEVGQLLASFIVHHGKTQELDVLLHDIELESGRRGLLQAHINSTHPLSDSTRRELKAWLNSNFAATRIKLNQTNHPSLVGGLTIQAAGRELNLTVAHKLELLKKGTA